MPTAYDVPPAILIERLKAHLEQDGKIKPPVWAPFARTGVHTEKAPSQADWWFRRVASVLRKVYVHGPIGTAQGRKLLDKLATELLKELAAKNPELAKYAGGR